MRGKILTVLCFPPFQHAWANTYSRVPDTMDNRTTQFYYLYICWHHLARLVGTNSSKLWLYTAVEPKGRVLFRDTAVITSCLTLQFVLRSNFRNHGRFLPGHSTRTAQDFQLWRLMDKLAMPSGERVRRSYIQMKLNWTFWNWKVT